MRPSFVRAEPWLQAGKYVRAVMSGLPKRNGWSIAEHAGDRTPDRTQRLLNHAAWDTFAAMGVVRRFAVAGLDEAARRPGRRGAIRIGALDESGQEKKGEATCGVKRQHLGCAGGVENGINTVHLSYVREKTGTPMPAPHAAYCKEAPAPRYAQNAVISVCPYRGNCSTPESHTRQARV